MSETSGIREIARWLKTFEHITAFTGAGISVPSGIPDFRSEKSGLWHKVDPMKVASLSGFRRNPQAFYDWVRPLTHTILNAKPNPAHLALAELEERGKLDCVITQNIDMLHTRAGNQTVYEIHGHLREATCIQCFHVVQGQPILEKFLKDNTVPRCGCGGVLKPNTILFGEQLPIQELQAAQRAARDCDVMLVVGSSLEVAPASDIPLLAKRHGAKVAIINLEPIPQDRIADVVIHGDAAEILPAIITYLDSV